MNEHLRRGKNQEIMVHYPEKDIQSELRQTLAGAIKNKVLSLVKSAKYYSIILDCTPDVSRIEQMTMIIRFVDNIKLLDSEMFKPAVIIREYFLGFVPLDETTIHNRNFEKFEQIELQIENLRGQGYNNGSNMKRKRKKVYKTEF